MNFSKNFFKSPSHLDFQFFAFIEILSRTLFHLLICLIFESYIYKVRGVIMLPLSVIHCKKKSRHALISVSYYHRLNKGRIKVFKVILFYRFLRETRLKHARKQFAFHSRDIVVLWLHAFRYNCV